jgi:Tol biopolymer transport system component
LLVAAWTVEALLHLPRLGDPQISPNGAALAWVQQGEVRTSLVEGAGTPKLVHLGSRPRWSPDSKTLAFIAPLNGVSQIYLYDAQSGSVRQLTTSPAPVGAYSWAADGRSVGYLSVDPGPPPDPEVSGEYTGYSHLYLQVLDSKQGRRITAAKEHVTSFALSPSGAEAVYAVHKTPRNQDSLQSDLFKVDLKTLESKPLVVQPGRDGDPSYSPDGKWVAFHSQDGSMNYFDPRASRRQAALSAI